MYIYILVCNNNICMYNMLYVIYVCILYIQYSNTLIYMIYIYTGKLHADKRQISVGVIGYPNSGKSSVINSLMGKKCCKVAPIPGIYILCGIYVYVRMSVYICNILFHLYYITKNIMHYTPYMLYIIPTICVYIISRTYTLYLHQARPRCGSI